MILVISAVLGLRRGPRSQLVLMSAIFGSWLVLGVEPSLAEAVNQNVRKVVGFSLSAPTLFAAIVVLSYFATWRMGPRQGGLVGSPIGGLLGLACGCLVAYTLFYPPSAAASILPASMEGGKVASSMEQVSRQVGGPRTLILGAVFVIVFLAVRAIRPPDFKDWFTREDR
jgi:hypothetical protein